MQRSTALAIGLLALAGIAQAAPPKTAHKPAHKEAAKAPPACEPGEASFWKDQGLTTKVATKLQFHKGLLREKVEVKVTGGAVMLSGNLSSQALIDEAVRTAKDVGGVKCVQNFLHVGPPILSGPDGQQP
jgi:hypothetical protein